MRIYIQSFHLKNIFMNNLTAVAVGKYLRTNVQFPKRAPTNS